MSRYNIFAGLGGGYGGAVWIETTEDIPQGLAENIASEAAWEVYESYGGLSGIDHYSWDDFVEEVGEDNATDEEYARIEEENFDSWADYYIEEAPSDPDYEYDGALR